MEETLKLFIRYILLRHMHQDWRAILQSDYRDRGSSYYESLVDKLGKAKRETTSALAKNIGLDIDKEFPI